MWRVLCLAALLAACVGAPSPFDIGGCGPSRRMCTSVMKCVSLSRVCDGKNDCGDYSDEWDCAGFTCPPNRFKCTRGGCIPDRWRCDDYDDCDDGSDEANCPASSSTGLQTGQQAGAAPQQQQTVQQQASDDDEELWGQYAQVPMQEVI